MTDKKENKVCGIVMPISNIDECSENHWTEVADILNDAIHDAGFEGNMVSHADDVGIIHKRIIQNLYDNPIVVCDVSCKNPNVMFELGLRLAFDKPTIIVKDDKTTYSFDTSAIEHLDYPRDLRFAQIVEFKKLLADKIKATYTKSVQDSNYTTFLKHFGEFKVAKIDKKEVSGQEFIIEELKNIRRNMIRLEGGRVSRRVESRLSESDINICLGGKGKHELTDKMKILMEHPALRDIGIKEIDRDHYHLTAEVDAKFDKNSIQDEIEMLVGRPTRTRRLRKTEHNDE